MKFLNDQVLQKCAEEISIDQARTPNIQFHRDKGTVYLATADAIWHDGVYDSVSLRQLRIRNGRAGNWNLYA